MAVAEPQLVSDRRCPTCFRPFCSASSGVDLSKHCPRIIPGDAYVIACLLLGLEKRDELLEGWEQSAAPPESPCGATAELCNLPRGHAGHCRHQSEAEKRFLETGRV